MPRLCEVYPGICLTNEKKARKNLSQGSRRMPVGTLKTEYIVCLNSKAGLLHCPAQSKRVIVGSNPLEAKAWEKWRNIETESVKMEHCMSKPRSHMPLRSAEYKYCKFIRFTLRICICTGNLDRPYTEHLIFVTVQVSDERRSRMVMWSYVESSLVHVDGKIQWRLSLMSYPTKQTIKNKTHSGFMFIHPSISHATLSYKRTSSLNNKLKNNEH